MNILIGLIVLGVIILVHEWGHFIVARLFGVRVDVFSIGFGPRLFGVKRGDTDWRFSALPLGGYVRMAGQDLTDIDSGDAKPTGAPDELMSKTRWQRALISFAGPAINLLFPIVLLGTYLVIAGEPYPSYLDKPVSIVGIPSQSAAASGLEVGDKIIAINGVQNPTWRDAYHVLESNPSGGTLKVQAEAPDGTSHERNVSFKNATDEYPFGFPPISPKVLQVIPGRPAAAAGMKDGDLIRSLNGQKIDYWDQFVYAIHKSQGQTLPVEISRNGQSLTLSVTPIIGAAQTGDKVYQIGIGPDVQVSRRSLGVVDSFKSAYTQTASFVYETVGVVVKLVTGRVSVRDLQSVVGISRAAGEAVTFGPSATILFMALISVNLGILNLLPIPILDGGHIVLLTLEGLRRRDFSLAFKERLIQVGLVFLLVLIVYVTYNDVARIFTRHS
jgi:regulator of sigma E protease